MKRSDRQASAGTGLDAAPASQGLDLRRAVLGHLRPGRVARVLVPATGALVLLTVLTRLVPALDLRALDPDAETALPAQYNAAVLVLAGTVSLLGRRAVYRLLGSCLVALALDELFWVHERLERALATDWQTVYLPVFAVAVVVLVLVLRAAAADAPSAPPLVAGGAACWVVSQVLEQLQWDGGIRRPGYTVMMLAEESLEVAGSVALLLGVLLAVRAGSEPSAHPSVRTRRPTGGGADAARGRRGR